MNLLSNNQPAPDDIIKFSPGESHLRAAMKEQINALIALLQDRPLLVLTLTGFADSSADSQALRKAKKTPTQTSTSQEVIADKQLLSLANRRAQAVQTLLTDQGISPQRIRMSSPKLINAGKAGPSGCRVSISLAPPL